MTLKGWENIAWHLSWKAKNIISYPDHTSSNAGRVPGLLHLSFSNVGNKSKKVELIFTDAPGEWFGQWKINQNHLQAEGARWIHQHSDIFLLFADGEKFSGQEKGKARRDLIELIDRLAVENKKPLGLVWAKSDNKISKEIKEALRTSLENSSIKSTQEFEISALEVKYHDNILKVMSWVLQEVQKIRSEPIKLSTPPSSEETNFFLLKRNY